MTRDWSYTVTYDAEGWYAVPLLYGHGVTSLMERFVAIWTVAYCFNVQYPSSPAYKESKYVYAYRK